MIGRRPAITRRNRVPRISRKARNGEQHEDPCLQPFASCISYWTSESCISPAPGPRHSFWIFSIALAAMDRNVGCSGVIFSANCLRSRVSTIARHTTPSLSPVCYSFSMDLGTAFTWPSCDDRSRKRPCSRCTSSPVP